jgi:hypothetical protein
MTDLKKDESGLSHPAYGRKPHKEELFGKKHCYTETIKGAKDYKM